MDIKPTITQSPHVSHPNSTTGIMLDVIIALMPAAIAGVVLFGYRSALVVAVCVIAALASEFIWNKILKKENSLGDLSAVVTGLLLALNMPPAIPLWIAALGSVIAIIVVKQMFGGLGQNFANPAITARIVLMVSFPTYMASNWIEPFTWMTNGISAVSGATPLAASPNASYTLSQLFLGTTPGCIGETCALLLLIGGIYLCVRRVISPIIPVAFIASLALMSFIFGHDPLAAILSGGVMLGAIFMATDYATSPTLPLGKLIFGIGCGLITFVIREFGSLPEGVSYSILIMNILTPHIDRLAAKARKPFGWEAAK